MLTDDFDFELPRERIAQKPAEPRDSARLLDVGPSLADRVMGDLPGLLEAGDLLVVNDTRVIPSRLVGRRGEAGIEVTLHLRRGPVEWLAFARPTRRLKAGDVIRFADDLTAEVTAKHDGGEIALRFENPMRNRRTGPLPLPATPRDDPMGGREGERAGASLSGDDLDAALQRHGIMPLPPYIGRSRDGDAADRDDYQTIYATHPGAVAAPTAGLHFTDELFAAIEGAGVGIARLTLHVGAGTFLPVKVERIADHRMHAEWGRIDAATAARIQGARDAGGRIVAAGTTSLRLLEAAAPEAGRIAPFEGETDIFITPGYRFRMADLLLTNFHLPRSTLFMLVAAFSGLARMKAAYAHAVARGYRFYSYGDACLLHRSDAP